MIDYTHDDGGRQQAGFKGKTGDCLIRAPAIASGIPYREVYDPTKPQFRVAGYRAVPDPSKAGKKSRRGQPTKARCQEMVLERFGFRKVALAGPRPTYSEAFRQFGTCVARTRKHWVALKDGALRDTFDSRTYTWNVSGPDMDGGWNDFETTCERKAITVWLPPAAKK